MFTEIAVADGLPSGRELSLSTPVRDPVPLCSSDSGATDVPCVSRGALGCAHISSDANPRLGRIRQHLFRWLHWGKENKEGGSMDPLVKEA